jgi:hypothetical protein
MSTIIIKKKNVKAAKPKKAPKAAIGIDLNPLSNCVRAAGAGPAAILLYRIRYWMPRASIEKLGEKWIVKTRAEWAAETGLSETQYDRAIAQLKQLDLVVCKQMPWKGDNVTHVRLTLEVQAMLDARQITTAPQPSPFPVPTTVAPTMPTKKTAAIQPKKSWAELDAETDDGVASVH